MKDKLKRDFKSKFNEGDNENYLGLQMVEEIFDFFYAEIEAREKLIDVYHSFTEGADVPESVPSCGDGWISVKDRLPDEEHDYIVFVDGEQPFVAHFFLYPADGSNWICYGHAVFPTHWQPLPKAPTKH